MPRAATVPEAVAAALAVATRAPDRTVWIGVDGFGAAGKTTLAAEIACALEDASVVHVDDFAGPGVAEWDWERFRTQLVLPLLAGLPARYQVWDWNTDSGGEWVDVAPGRVLVVEGVSSTRSEVGLDWDLTVWVDAPRELRLARARRRDGEAMLARWLSDWMPSEERYAERERPRERVDLVVDGSALS
jgi:uridine kinase